MYDGTLPTKHDTSPHFHTGAKCRNAAPALLTHSCPIAPNGETHMVLSAANDGAERAVSERAVCNDEVAQAPWFVSPGIIQRREVEDGTRNESLLVAEDWLEAADALLDTVADRQTDA